MTFVVAALNYAVDNIAKLPVSFRKFVMVLLFCVCHGVKIRNLFRYATIFENYFNFNIWAQKKRHPPAWRPPKTKTDEKHKTLPAPNIGINLYSVASLRPNTTALIMRFKISTTLSSFVLSVNAVIVPAAVRMAKANLGPVR